MDSAQHSALIEEIRTNCGKVASDYAFLTGISTRMLYAWLRTDEDARQLVKQGFVAIEEGKPVPNWALDENGQVYPAIRRAQRTQKAPQRDLQALVPVPDSLNDEQFDKKLSAFREREISKLGPRPRDSAIYDANMAIASFKDTLRTAQTDKIMREAAEDAKARADEIIEEKDKRLAMQELVIEQLQQNITPGRAFATRPTVGRH